MAFDRSKFKGAKLSANKEVQKQAAEVSKTNTDGRASFFSVEEGKNVFRIMPPHPNCEIGAAYMPKRTAMLECEVDKYKDGEPTGDKEVKRKAIFIATQHGGLSKDPIELYIDYVYKRANDEFSDKEDRRKFMNPVTGYRSAKGWVWGIKPSTTFVAYALKEGQLGRLEMYESWIKQMDKIAMQEEADEVISVDPFSNPDEGYPLVITKEHKLDKDGKPTTSWEYTLSKDIPSEARRENWDQFFERVKITDEQLEKLMEQKPLSDYYGNKVYTQRDFDFALDGLKRFDDANKYQIFDNEEFLDEIEALSKEVPEDKPKDDSDVDDMFNKKGTAKAPKTTTKPVVKEEAEDEMTPAEMKIALKRFVKKVYGADFVDQIPTKAADVKEWYALMEDGDELPFEEEAPEEVEAEEVGDVDEAGAIDSSQYDDQIAALRRGSNRKK